MLKSLCYSLALKKRCMCIEQWPNKNIAMRSELILTSQKHCDDAPFAVQISLEATCMIFALKC